MQTANIKIALLCEDMGQTERAADLAERLQIPLVADNSGCDFLLVVTAQRLELRQIGPGSPGPVAVDFSSPALSHRRTAGGGRKQLLAKAVGLKHNRCPFVLDATAGLGRDAFILASLGCRVQLVERSPIVAALLEDGLNRAKNNPETGDIAARMTMQPVDSTSLSTLSPLPDVIYLDPMYPHRTKSALVKKEMRLIRALVGDDHDASALLDWALSHQGVRVVVKRPKGAPRLSDKPPSTEIKSKNSRFDIYL